MTYLKSLGLLAMVAISLTMSTGLASATVLTSPAGTEYTGEVKMSAVETLTLKAAVFTATCTVSEINFSIAKNTTAAEGPVTKRHFTSCDSTVKTIANGSLQVNASGEVFGTGDEVTTEKFGTSCIYGADTFTKIGTLTSGTTAQLTIAAELIKQEPGSGALCGAKAKWTGKYSVTSPDTLLLN